MNTAEELREMLEIAFNMAKVLDLDPILLMDVVAFTYANILFYWRDEWSSTRLVVKGCASRKPEYCIAAALVILYWELNSLDSNTPTLTMHV